MVTNSDASINQRIIDMRNQHYGVQRIMDWLQKWDNFSQLDEQIILAHILNVFKKNNLPIKKREIRMCFLLYYRKNLHGDKQSYLKFLYNLMEDNPLKKVVSGPTKLSLGASVLHDNQNSVNIPSGVENE